MRLSWPDFALLEQLGLSVHERKVLLSLCVLGMADAATLCREAGVATSKIYRITEKLHALGLLERTRARPALYTAPGPDELLERLKQLKRRQAEAFALEADALREKLRGLPQKLGTRSSRVDLALGAESHVKRHLTRLATAQSEVLSYLERGDFVAMQCASEGGFNIWKHLAQALPPGGLQHRVVFGFAPVQADQLLGFLRAFAPWLNHLSGLRYAGVMGHPFHVIDRRQVILALDHPFVSAGRFASLLVEDTELAARLAEGFDGLWAKALRDLREVRAVPVALLAPAPTRR